MTGASETDPSLRRVGSGEAVIVVSGLPRSGTSMTMQMLAAASIPVITDGVREPGEDNPRGYFEDERVKALHKEGEDRSWLDGVRGKAIKIISFFLRDLPPSNRYKVLFMRRDLREVLSSQRRMIQRRGEPLGSDEEGMYEILERHLAEVERLIRESSHFEILNVEYRDVIADPRREAIRIRDFLGLDLDVERMAGAVDSGLYRNRA
jgi:hypothetical protein